MRNYWSVPQIVGWQKVNLVLIFNTVLNKAIKLYLYSSIVIQHL